MKVQVISECSRI